MTDGNNEYVGLRRSIQRAFPAETYVGRITHYDGLDRPELDDEKGLYEALNGQRWTDVPPQLLNSQPDGYELLTDEAFQAFIAAWLIRSLENLDGDNEIRDFVIYAFSPKHNMVPDTTESILQRLRSLTHEQRATLRSLLLAFAKRDLRVSKKTRLRSGCTNGDLTLIGDSGTSPAELAACGCTHSTVLTIH